MYDPTIFHPEESLKILLRQVFWLAIFLNAFPPKGFGQWLNIQTLLAYSSGDCSGFSPDSRFNDLNGPPQPYKGSFFA